MSRLRGWSLALLVTIACAGCLAAGSPTPAAAVATELERGPVTRVIDGDTIDVRLDERGVVRVRLIGIDAPELGREGREADPLARAATGFVRELAEGRTVRLERDAIGDTRDAYGRLLRYVWIDGELLLNREIVANGYARAMTRFRFTRSGEFRRVEAAAATAGLGLWADRPRQRLSTDEAADHLGEWASVCGTVASTRYVAHVRGRPTFLNLDRPYPDQPFTIVIWGDDRAAFGKPERDLDGARLCVTGLIERRRGRPQIVARDPSQLVRSPGPAPG